MSSVCDTQDTFNKSFKKAIEARQKENKPKLWIVIVSIVLMAIFIFWALMLAVKIPTDYRRVEHLFLAILFSPIYIVSYYIGIKDS